MTMVKSDHDDGKSDNDDNGHGAEKMMIMMMTAHQSAIALTDHIRHVPSE